MSTLIVVGGVAAGMSAASKARRIDPAMRVIALERTGRAACPTTCCGRTFRWSAWS